PGRMVKAWQDLTRRGFKIRSRALTNTMFARLFVAEVFIHGIGGAKYDELTDEIIRRFYGIEPPQFMVFSATLRLPLQSFPVTATDHNRLAVKLRDMRYNPQRHLPESALREQRVQQLMKEKQLWVDWQPAQAHERRRRFEIL